MPRGGVTLRKTGHAFLESGSRWFHELLFCAAFQFIVPAPQVAVVAHALLFSSRYSSRLLLILPPHIQARPEASCITSRAHRVTFAAHSFPHASHPRRRSRANSSKYGPLLVLSTISTNNSGFALCRRCAGASITFDFARDSTGGFPRVPTIRNSA